MENMVTLKPGYRPLPKGAPDTLLPYNIALEVAYTEHYLRRLAGSEIELRRAAEARHREDIATIGARLLEEAKERRWCPEYDAIVREVNRELHVELPVRPRTFKVTVRATVYIEVDARDEDDARSKARAIARAAESEVDSTEGVETSAWDDTYDYDVEEAD